jgi:hypothetical protein
MAVAAKTKNPFDVVSDIGSIFGVPHDLALMSGLATQAGIADLGPAVGTDWAAGGSGTEEAGNGLSVLGLPLGAISMGLGLSELEKGQISQGALDVSAGATSAAGGIATLAGADGAAAALGPLGAALGLEAAGNKFTTDLGLWGVGTDANGATHNRTGFERMEDNMSEAYEDYGVVGAGAVGLVDGAETVVGNLLGGVASVASTIGGAIGSIFSW